MNLRTIKIKCSKLRSNVGLSTRLKPIEVICAACTVIDPRYRAYAYMVEMMCVIIYANEIGTLYAIHPECQAAIVRTFGGRGTPIHLNEVQAISNRKPAGAFPTVAIVA